MGGAAEAWEMMLSILCFESVSWIFYSKIKLDKNPFGDEIATGGSGAYLSFVICPGFDWGTHEALLLLLG